MQWSNCAKMRALNLSDQVMYFTGTTRPRGRTEEEMYTDKHHLIFSDKKNDLSKSGFERETRTTGCTVEPNLATFGNWI